MARSKLNLGHLSEEERAQILRVLQRDFILQHLDEQRLGHIKAEVEEEGNKSHVLAKYRSFTESCCIRCFSRFFFIFNRKQLCSVCRFYVCKNCCELVQETIRGNCKKIVCKACLKLREFQCQSNEWFRAAVQKRFKHTGSDKVIRCLADRRSIADLESAWLAYGADLTTAVTASSDEVSDSVLTGRGGTELRDIGTDPDDQPSVLDNVDHPRPTSKSDTESTCTRSRSATKALHTSLPDETWRGERGEVGGSPSLWWEEDPTRQSSFKETRKANVEKILANLSLDEPNPGRMERNGNPDEAHYDRIFLDTECSNLDQALDGFVPDRDEFEFANSSSSDLQRLAEGMSRTHGQVTSTASRMLQSADTMSSIYQELDELDRKLNDLEGEVDDVITGDAIDDDNDDSAAEYQQLESSAEAIGLVTSAALELLYSAKGMTSSSNYNSVLGGTTFTERRLPTDTSQSGDSSHEELGFESSSLEGETRGRGMKNTAGLFYDADDDSDRGNSSRQTDRVEITTTRRAHGYHQPQQQLFQQQQHQQQQQQQRRSETGASEGEVIGAKRTYKGPNAPMKKTEEKIYLTSGKVFSLEEQVAELERMVQMVDGNTSGDELEDLEEEVARAVARVSRTETEVTEIEESIRRNQQRKE